MKSSLLSFMILVGLASAAWAVPASAPTISGDYLEVRSCDVYTGPCFANSEMGLCGKEGLLVWKIRAGTWEGTRLNGLSVIAAVRTDATLGNLHYHPRNGRAVLVVDAKADARQRRALIDFARVAADGLIHDVAGVRAADMDVAIGTCAKAGCASVRAGNLVEISTRCLGDKDHLCGNEVTFYPPLTDVRQAHPAFAEVAAFNGPGLDETWQLTDKRSAFLGEFAR
ncbi:MAG: DUF1326 domain-containing protein [Verrucomicrobia bacterium]|nr:DUF1326 domain-containing protein [Verrucomicrobiota bacterium]